MASLFSVVIASLFLSTSTTNAFAKALEDPFFSSVRAASDVKRFKASYNGIVRRPGMFAAANVMVSGYQNGNGYVHCSVNATMYARITSAGLVGGGETSFRGTYLYLNEAKITGFFKSAFVGEYSGLPLKMDATSEMSMTIFQTNSIRLRQKGTFKTMDKAPNTVKLQGSFAVYIDGDETTYTIQGMLEGKKFNYKIVRAIEDTFLSMNQGVYGEYNGLFNGKPWKGKWPMPKKAVTGPN